MRVRVCAFREVKLMMMMVNLFPFPGITFGVTFFWGGENNKVFLHNFSLFLVPKRRFAFCRKRPGEPASIA